jgi:hypothetical protein
MFLQRMENILYRVRMVFIILHIHIQGDVGSFFGKNEIVMHQAM